LGSLEILSQAAVEAFSWGRKKCREELKYKTKAENVFLQQCLELLNVSSVYDGDMVADDSCEPAQCSDLEKAGYSPHINVTDWLNCWEVADQTALFGDVPVDTIVARVRLRMRKLQFKLKRLLK